jgi:hypothetical protein
MKKLFIISGLLLVFLMGSGCISIPANLPTASSILPTTTVGSASNYPKIVESSAFATTGSQQFSDPSADFTFEYPNTWEYKKDVNQDMHSNGQSWSFKYKGNLSFNVLGHMDDPRGFDGCWPHHILEEKTYSTNDPSTVLIEQICGLCVNEEDNTKGFEGNCEMQKTPYGANIYFIPGEKIKTLDTIWSLPKEKINNLHLFILQSPFQYDRYTHQKRTDEEYSQFIEWARQIVGSVKMVKP